jgi:hypothetical protein
LSYIRANEEIKNTFRALFSLLKTKKHLNFNALNNSMAECFAAIPDPRQQLKCDYSQHDILMSAFAQRVDVHN